GPCAGFCRERVRDGLPVAERLGGPAESAVEPGAGVLVAERADPGDLDGAAVLERTGFRPASGGDRDELPVPLESDADDVAPVGAVVPVVLSDERAGLPLRERDELEAHAALRTGRSGSDPGLVITA